jgi:type IV pilus assembly protein PilA
MRTNTNKGQSGFSLVELMVVVGIIGLLAAIAVPQFSKFQARARQSEAKAMLASIFTGEKSFFAEWNGYTASMNHAGVGTTGNKVRYDGGVGNGLAVCTGTYPPGAPGDAYVTVFTASNSATSSTAVYDLGAAMGQPAVVFAGGGGTGLACDNGAKTFTAVVAGDPNNLAVTPFDADQWRISDTKVISNFANGIR